jgi:hypothetical protein
MYQTTKMFKKNIKKCTIIGYGPLFCQNKKEGEQKRGEKLTKLIGIKTPMIIRKTLKQNNKVSSIQK